MRTIDLQEYEKSESYRLSVDERDTLRKVPSLTIEPAPGVEGAYHLTPGSTTGALEIGNLSVSILPKLDISRVLFLASYALGAFKLREMERFNFEDASSLIEALALALATAARRAFASGLLHGYRTEEEAMHTVRGRIRISEQIRRRFGVPLPLEVRYDEFYGRHHGKPFGEGSRYTARTDAGSLATVPVRPALGQYKAGECFACRVPEERRA